MDFIPLGFTVYDQERSAQLQICQTHPVCFLSFPKCPRQAVEVLGTHGMHSIFLVSTLSLNFRT